MLTPAGNEFEWQATKRKKEFLLDEAKSTFTQYFGTSKEDKQAMVEISEGVFGCKSWTGIEQLDLPQLAAAMTPPSEGTPCLLEQRCIERKEQREAKEVSGRRVDG